MVTPESMVMDGPLGAKLHGGRTHSQEGKVHQVKPAYRTVLCMALCPGHSTTERGSPLCHPKANVSSANVYLKIRVQG